MSAFKNVLFRINPYRRLNLIIDKKFKKSFKNNENLKLRNELYKFVSLYEVVMYRVKF